MASICLTIAINEFLTWFRRSKKNSDIAFVLICLGGTFFCLFCAGEYDVDLPAQSVFWLKGQVISISFTSLALFWFYAEETGLIKRRYILAYLLWTILVASSQVLDVGDLAWIVGRPFELRVRLPFGLDFIYKEVERGTLLDCVDFVGFILLVYLALVVIKFRRSGKRRDSFVLLLVLGIVVAAEVNDFFVGTGVYSFLYLMEYAWLALILIVGLRRSNEVMDAAQTKLALARSDRELRESQATLSAIIDSTSDMIWSVDLESFRLLSCNESLGEYFSRKYGVRVRAGMGLPELFPSEEQVAFWRGIYERATIEGAHSFEHRMSSDSSVFQISVSPLKRDGKVFGVSAFAKDITERKEAEDRIQRSLAEKETLLRELYHRTKNNMNVIISMLRLQSREIGDERLKAAFGESEARIISMSLVHEKLYGAQDLSRINLREYIEDLIRHLMSNYNLSSRLPSLSFRMEDVYVMIDTAITCGLIVNELIANSLKYAFPGDRVGEIGVWLSRDEDGEISLSVSDDGVGVPPGFDAARDGHLGMRLVNNLAQGKIRASVTFETDHGVSCHLRFRDA
jgi:PAS domain S-box-containing protein